MPAGVSSGLSPGAARTLSAAAAATPQHQTHEDVDSFPLPPEMLKAWPDLEGVEDIDGPPYVTLDAPEAELLGYPTPTSAASASAGQDLYQFDPDDVDALALKSLQATGTPAEVCRRPQRPRGRNEGHGSASAQHAHTERTERH